MQTNTLEISAGHSAVSGAHRCPAGSLPAVAEVSGADATAEVSAAAGTSPVVINEAYLSGGSTGAAYKNKFVELYNTSDAPVSLDGWSLQYRSATGSPRPPVWLP